MENNSETVKNDLKVLELQDKEIENLSISEVIRAYRKLARFVHPDTSGYESTADFQVLGNAYERLLSIVVEKTNAEESKKESELKTLNVIEVPCYSKVSHGDQHILCSFLCIISYTCLVT